MRRMVENDGPSHSMKRRNMKSLCIGRVSVEHGQWIWTKLFEGGLR